MRKNHITYLALILLHSSKLIDSAKIGTSYQCIDTDNGATDSDGYSCEPYYRWPEDCGLYDDDDFSSLTMCCACKSTILENDSCIGKSFNFDDYFPWQNHMDYLTCLYNRFPDRTQLIKIGKSVEGRELRVIKIGKPRSDGVPKPAIWIDGGIHAREWISPAATEYVITQLVENCTELVASFDIYVIPILNPDGYDYTHLGGIDETGKRRRDWRKNRAIDPETGCIGVDLNRNWGYEWGGLGASDDPCNDPYFTYRGPAPFSEPETSSVRDFIIKQRQIQEFVMFLTLHSKGKYILHGWGYDELDPPNVEELQAMGNIAVKAMSNKFGGYKYKLGGAAKLLYPASGGSDDWALGSGFFRYSYTIELPPSNENPDDNSGFELPANRILSVSQEIFTGITAMMRELMNEIRI